MQFWEYVMYGGLKTSYALSSQQTHTTVNTRTRLNTKTTSFTSFRYDINWNIEYEYILWNV